MVLLLFSALYGCSAGGGLGADDPAVRLSEYKMIGSVFDGYVTVVDKDGEKQNIVNLADGGLIFDVFANKAGYLRHGYFYALRNDENGLDSKIFDIGGKIVCDKIDGCEFLAPTQFIDGKFRVTLMPSAESGGASGCVYVGTDFKVVSYDPRWIDYREGAKVAVYDYEVEGGENDKEATVYCGLMDYNTFEFITEPIFKNCAPFIGEYGVAVTMDNRLVVIDAEGGVVFDISEEFAAKKDELGEINLEFINPYDERGYAVNFEAADGKKTVVILNGAKQASIIDGTEAKVDQILEFRGSYAVMQYAGKQGIIDRQANVVIAAEYDYICPFDGDFTYAKKGDDYYIISLKQQ